MENIIDINQLKRMSCGYVRNYFSSYSPFRHHKARAQQLYQDIVQCHSTEDIINLFNNELIYIRHSGFLHTHYRNSAYVMALHKILMLIYPPRALLFALDCSYNAALIKFCETKKIQYRQIVSSDLWLRDYLFEAPKKLYIRNKNGKYAHIYERDTYGYIRTHHYQLDSGLRVDVPRMNSLCPRNITEVKPEFVYSSNRCLEGGNLFAVHNLCGDKYYIIGERVEDFELIVTQKKSYMKPGQKKDITAIDRYKEIFGTDKIIIVPNLSYHMDLQMAYVGQGTFLIHSFAETQKWFPTEYQQYVAEYKRRWPSVDVIAEKEKQVDVIVKLLREAHFKVIKFCGNLYHADKMNIWSGTGLKSTFVNGIDIYSNEEDQHYFVTIDSDDMLGHKQYFMEQVMNGLNIKPYFVTNQSGNIENTIDEINTRKGALRCQTNFIDANKVA